MAIAIDQLTIGSKTEAPASSGASQVLTTSAAVASGGFIVIVASFWSGSATFTSVTGGGLSWTIDNQGHAGAPGSPNIAIVSAQASSGLASSTALTINYSLSEPGRACAAMSFTGVATSSPVDATGTSNGASSTTAWTTTSVALAAGSVLIGASYNESTNLTSAPTAPSVENFEIGTSGELGLTAAHRVESSAASYTVAGAWSSSCSSNTLAVAYKAAAGAAAPITTSNPFSSIPLVRGPQ